MLNIYTQYKNKKVLNWIVYLEFKIYNQKYKNIENSKFVIKLNLQVRNLYLKNILIEYLFKQLCLLETNPQFGL